MNQLDEYARKINVDIVALLDKVQQGIDGVSINHFTDEELLVIREALEFAGGM